jgi:Gas vesicle synthesis protein GvpL/GvpF
MTDPYVIWVYAIVSGLGPSLPDGLTGIGGEPIRAVSERGVCALIGSVDSQVFGEKALQQSLSEPGQLEAIARAHHDVVEAVAAADTVIPARLATVYRDQSGVRGLLTERGEEFAETLRWLSGRVELGAKVWVDPGLLASQVPVGQADAAPAAGTRAPAAGGTPGVGTQYLRQRRANLTARDNSWQQAARLSDDIHATLAGLAVAARRHAAQEPRPGDDHGQMVLNGAYLIEAAQDTEFVAAAFASEREGVEVEVTGPWPPYSFAEGPDR